MAVGRRLGDEADRHGRTLRPRFGPVASVPVASCCRSDVEDGRAGEPVVGEVGRAASACSSGYGVVSTPTGMCAAMARNSLAVAPRVGRDAAQLALLEEVVGVVAAAGCR